MVKFDNGVMKQETKIFRYTAEMPMRSLIVDNSLLLMVLSRFNISLGFGDGTVEEVCTNNNVDTDTFLTICNFTSGKPCDLNRISLSSLIGYLKQAHSYFIGFILPVIRRKLIEALNCANIGNITLQMLKFYDDYVEEVRRHLDYENTHVFTYVESLLKGETSDNFRIDMFLANHKPIGTKLAELKDIFIRHYNQPDNDLLNSALFDIITCEQDLLNHCEVEDVIFVPAVRDLEKRVSNGEFSELKEDKTVSQTPNLPGAVLSEREKQIIVCVAKGLANKQIADELNISIHTVTTHRRNISAKLDVHSTAGLTLYAVIHGLIDLRDVK